MSERLRALMVAHGAAVFLAGLAAGFPFAFVILEKIAMWPFPGEIQWSPPGDYRAWRMAHLEGILNGLTLIAVAAAGASVALSDRAQNIVAWGLIVAAWGNFVASVIGPIVGGRGLEFGGGAGNSVVYLLFVIAIFAVVAAMVLVLKGALARLAEAEGRD